MDTRLTPRQRTQRAFTLIELLVVIAIIAILAAILFPVFGTVREQARQSGTMSNMHAVFVGARLFYEDEGRYPSVLFGYAEQPAPFLGAATPPRPPQHPSLSLTGNTPMDQSKQFFSVYTFTVQEGVNRGYLYPEQVKDYVTFTTPDNPIKDKTATTQVYYPHNAPNGLGDTVVMWKPAGSGACPD
ncbi:MAG: prepilin-type N-terminal cleavage/methylation domain, partial [Chthonomonadales bacterium]|nr:prepilin-type N-terminal cleavage/methylation domain [Chthonomonadales bacterium]